MSGSMYGDTSESDSEDSDTYASLRRRRAGGTPVARRAGGTPVARRRPRSQHAVVPRLVLQMPAATVVQAQTLSDAELAELKTAVADIANVTVLQRASLIVRIALVTEIAFALAKANLLPTPTTSTTGPPEGNSVNNVRHTAQLGHQDQDALHHALLALITSLEPSTELPATALLCLGTVCTGDKSTASHTPLKTAWQNSLPVSFGMWERLVPFLRTLSTGVVAGAPCTQEDLDERVIKLLNPIFELDTTGGTKTIGDLADLVIGALGVSENLKRCNEKKTTYKYSVAETQAELKEQQAQVEHMQQQLELGEQRVHAMNLAAKEFDALTRTYETMTAQHDDILEMLQQDNAECAELKRRAADAEKGAAEVDVEKTTLVERVRVLETELEAAQTKCKDCQSKVDTAKNEADATALAQLKIAYEAARPGVTSDDVGMMSEAIVTALNAAKAEAAAATKTAEAAQARAAEAAQARAEAEAATATAVAEAEAAHGAAEKKVAEAEARAAAAEAKAEAAEAKANAATQEVEGVKKATPEVNTTADAAKTDTDNPALTQLKLAYVATGATGQADDAVNVMEIFNGTYSAE